MPEACGDTLKARYTRVFTLDVYLEHVDIRRCKSLRTPGAFGLKEI